MCPLPPTDDDVAFRRSVLLTAQVALLGELAASVRGVTLGWTASEIVVRAIVDGVVDDDDRESIECVGSEIIAGFPTHQIIVEVERVDAPAPIKERGLKAWVFMRKERRGG